MTMDSAARLETKSREFHSGTDLVVRHSFAKVAGVAIHWAEVGKETEATPVVLLHGLQDCHLTWKRVALSLARERHVLMPDLPGHGLSERP